MVKINQKIIKRFIKNNDRKIVVGIVIFVVGLTLIISAISKLSNKSVTLGALPNISNTTIQNIEDPTDNFKVSANWGIEWNYDCSNVTPQPGVFDVTVQDPNGTYSSNAESFVTNGVKGSGVQQESNAGTFQLLVDADSGCTWHVQVINNSAPTSINDVPAPAQAKPKPQPIVDKSSAKYSAYPSNSGGVPSNDINDWVNVAAAWVVNPADLRVYAEIKNIGGESGTPSCTIQANDPSSTYIGVDIVTKTSALKPGGIWDLADDLTITHQGANFVTQISVKCQNK